MTGKLIDVQYFKYYQLIELYNYLDSRNAFELPAVDEFGVLPFSFPVNALQGGYLICYGNELTIILHEDDELHLRMFSGVTASQRACHVTRRYLSQVTCHRLQLQVTINSII